MASKKVSTFRSARHRSAKRSTVGRDSGDQLSDRISFFQRSVRVELPPAVLEEADPHRVLMCDFLGLITAINKLYSQNNVLPMQQVDNAPKQPVSTGAVFEVSSITAKSARPSQIVADEIEEESLPVILKRSPLNMFTSQGGLLEDKDHRDQAASFIMELRILSDPIIRKNKNVVDLVGIGWEYTRSAETLCPWPCLILERAKCTLGEFLEKNSSLPFSTKHFLCLDVANGLAALHEAGIIHGDVKLDNVLVFERSRFVAKIADFSHAIFDTGEETRLVGGTAWYTAPEWKEKLPTPALKQTDTYSFGLVFASTILGYDVITDFLSEPNNGRTLEERAENLSLKKNEGTLLEYITNQIYDNDDFDISDASTAQTILELTLQVDSKKRNLSTALSHLATATVQDRQIPQGTIFKQLYDDILTIPYHALRSTSHLLKSQIVRALQNLVDEGQDQNARPERRSAACFELCVCYASGFGVERDPNEAVSWLVKAAQLGDPWGRAMIYRISTALNVSLPVDVDITGWLSSEAAAGSAVAFESLQELGFRLDRRSLATAQIHGYISSPNAETIMSETIAEVEDEENDYLERDPRGNTLVHRASMTGSLETLESLLKEPADTIKRILNMRNDIGDTALNIACKVGDYNLCARLIKNGADPTITNDNGENCLHHLICFDDQDVPRAAELFFEAGVDSTIDATATSLSSEYQVHPDASGCPKIRSILYNRPLVLDVILGYESSRKAGMDEAALRRHRIAPKKMLAWACRTSNHAVLKVLLKHCPSSFERHALEIFEIWIEERRHSLPALLISGCSGDKFGSGFRFPETFQRCLIYGSSGESQFEGTIKLLLDRGVDFNTVHCFGRRNALFYAIEQCREDIVSQLLRHSSFEDPLAVFGSPKAIPGPPRDGFGDSFYPMHPGGGPNHRRKEPMTDAIALAIEHGNREILQNILRYHNREALDRGEEYMVRAYDRLSNAENLKRRPAMGSRDRKTSYNPSKAMHFFPTLQPLKGAEHYGDIETVVPLSACGPTYHQGPVCDSRINYSLLYMSRIASSGARDIGLANILLEELQLKDSSSTQKWAVSNLLEQICLTAAIFSPLLVSALYGWDELMELLLSHGAKPNFKIFEYATSTTTTSLFSYLVETTRDNNDNTKCNPWDDGFSDEQSYGATLRMIKAILRADPENPRLSSSDIRKLVRSNKVFDKHQQQEIWEVIEERFRKAKCVGISHVNVMGQSAITYANPHALEVALKLGYPANGRASGSIFGTPLDEIKAKSYRDENNVCQNLIIKYGGRRSLVYTLEFQILGNIGYWILTAAFIYGVFGTVELQHKACIRLIGNWYEDYKSGSLSTWNVIFRVPFAYTPFIPIVITVIIMAIWQWIYWTDNMGEKIRVHMANIWWAIFGFSYATLNLQEHLTSQWYGPTWKMIRPMVLKFQESVDQKRIEKVTVADLEAGQSDDSQGDKEDKTEVVDETQETGVTGVNGVTGVTGGTEVNGVTGMTGVESEGVVKVEASHVS